MRVYLDACRLGHPQQRVREEADAVEQILAGVRLGTIEIVSSEALREEVRRNRPLSWIQGQGL